MGWKSVKEHYRIGHSVQVVLNKGICIGSPYIHDIIVISAEGRITKRDRYRDGGELARYEKEMDADPALLKALVDQPDTFERSITVWTYDSGHILECFCEGLGWPNVTHDGRMMYENTFFEDRAQAVEKAFRDARGSVTAWGDNLADRTRDMVEAMDRLREVSGHLERLLETETAHG